MNTFNRPVSNHAHKGITLSAAVALSLVLASCGSSSPAATTPTTPVTPLAVPNLANATATTLVVGTAATINFTNNGGGTLLADDATPNRGCTATNLPAGLAIGRTSNTNSCTITGTPNTATTEAVTVTVTARNATGVDATPATVSITINAADPVTTLALPNLAYTGTDVSAVIGTAITTITFANSGDGELLANDANPTPGCSTSPALPSGLTIQRTADGTSCEITGTPDAVKALDTYTVTARNATGPDTTAPEVKITVRAIATAAIPNFASRILGNVNIPLSITFTNNGDSVAATNGCTLKDAATLPTGLNLTAVDVEGTMTCRISGIPSQAKTATYTLVATSIDATTDEATFYLEVEAQEEDPQACQMSADYITTASTIDATSYPVTAGGETGRLYLNGGTITEGGDNPSFVLRYKGPVDSKHIYQAAVEFNAATATTNFKITSDDGTDTTEPTTQFYVQTATATTAADIETTALATDGTAQTVARGDATGVSTSNTADLSAENPFLFTLTLDTANPANGLGAGTLAIAACTDTTNPTATPTATPASSQSATAGAISFTASEAGTAYVLLLPPPGAGESAPDADAVVANAARVEENVEAGTASVSINTRTRADSTPLTAATTYAAYIVIRDEAGNLSEVTKVDITTTPAQTTDTTAPTISAVTVDGIVALGATLNLTSNEPGDVFVVTLPATTPAPTTADAIINPAVNSDSNEDNDIPHTRADITADTTTAVAITGLDPATDYTAHYTVVDVAGNATAVASTTPTFTTLELAPYLAPAIDQLNLVANSAEDGAVNIIFANLTGTTLLAQDATTPGCQATGLPAGLTITQIDQDEDDGGTTCQITGTVTLATTDGPVIATITATSAGGSSTTVVLFAVAAATTTTNPVLTVTGGTDARTFPIDALITPIVISFTNGGDNPACTVEPALPQGLNATLAADKMSCTIAGTPSAATASKVYTITVANGAQTGMATVTIGTTDPTDTTDPTLSPITATAPTGSSVTVNLTSTENGTGYVLVSATSATLTAQDVITRVNADAASDFVATPTLTADMAATANITGLQATTQYFVYAVATDASANPSTVGTTSFTTTVATDTTAPLLSATTVTATSDTTATVSLTSNEAGTGYILITARDAANTLDNAAIIARVIAAASSDVVATTAITIPGTATTTNITGLTASTTYTAYIVATDNATTPNNSTVATVDFATEAVADVTAPMISSFTVTALSLNEVQVEVVNNEDGDLSVIILPAADTTPTMPSAVTTPGPNTISLSAAVTERMSTHTVTGLASNTRYAAYAVLTDASGNPSAIAAIADVNAFATPNAPPVANAGSVSTVLVGGAATLNGTGSTDDDGAITTYAWAQTTTPTGVTGTLTGADTDTATFTPTAGTVAGDVVFTLTVTDNGNVEDNASPLTHSDTVTVTVALVADTTDPVISAVSSSNGTVNSVDITLTSNESGSVAVLAYLNGTTQPDVAAIKAATGDGSVQSNVEADTPLTLTVPGLSSNTLYILAIVATDGSANDSMVATENIVTDNAAPVASTSGSPTTANTGDPVMLTGTSSTDDGMIASYAWVETSNTTNTPITLDDNTSSTPSFTVASTSTAGEIVFTLTVTDDGVATTNLQPLSDTATVTIVVSDTTDPVFTELSPDVTIAAGPVTLSTVVLAFNSNEAGPVAMLVLPAGDDAPSADTIKEASGDGSIKGTAVAGQMQSLTAAGLNSNTSYSAHAVVTDLAGNDSEVASSASFKTLNAAPIANAGATQPVLANASVQLNGSGTDVDSDDMTLTYLWTQTSGTTVTLSSTSIANPTFDASVAADAGETLVFNLVVTDSDGLASVAASTSVVVAPVPLAVPDLQTPTSAAFVYVTGASIAISFANDGGKILTECVAVPALPTGLIIAPTADNASCTITGTAPATAVAIMPHTITASNAAGADATPVAITITINEAVNADPTITIATATNTVAPGAAVTLSGGCADSDGSIASCVWTYTSGGTAPALTPGTSGPATTATFIAANTGNTNITLVFTLTATDDEGATATATASVTITPVAEGTLVLDSVPGPIRIQVNVAIDTPIDFIISQGDPSGDATCSLTSNLLGSGLRVDFVATPQPLCRLSGTGSSAGSAGTITVQVMDGDRTSNAVMVRAGVSIASTVQNLTLTMYVGAVYRTDNANINSLRFSRFISEFDTTHTCTLPDDENLPRGLRLEVVSANTQCAIIGTPLEVTAEQTYSVTLNNGFGSSVSTLTLTVSNSVAPQFALPSEVTSLEAEQAITTPIQLVNTSVAANPEAAILKNCIQVNSANPDTARTIATSNGLTVNRNCTLTGTPTNPVETTIYIRATGMNRISGISAIVVPITTPGGNTGPTVTAVTATSDAPTTTTVTLTSSAAGQAYILVVADALDTLNMPTPTAIRTMVKAATEGATVETVDVTADMATTAKIGGLVANTLYKVYVATEDAQDIISQSAPSATFTTTVDLLVTPIEILHFRVVNQSIDPIDIAFTGTPTTPIACTSDNLPMGLEIAPLNGNSCQITGTPTIAALTEIEFRVTDASSPAAVGTGTVMILVSESLDGNTLGASSIVTKLSYRENEMRRESNGDLTGDSVISISSRFTSSTRNVVTCTAVDKPLPAGLETEATSFGKNCYIYGRALKATPLDTYTILVKSNLGSATVVISLEVLPAKLATLELPAMVPEIRLNKEIASTDSIKLVNTNTESGLNDVSCQLVTSNSVDASPVATGGQDGWQASGAGALCGIFGTPTKLGLNTLYVLIENKDGAKSVSTIEITTTAPVLTVDAPTEIQTVGFEQPIDPIILQVSGNPTTPVTCTATGIPAGLEIKPTTDTESCEIVGTPTALGDSTVAFTITDATIPASTVSGMVKIQVGNLPSTTEAITLSVRADESLGVRDVSDTSKNVPNIKLFFFTNGTVDPFFNPKTNACNFVTSEASPAGIMLETSSSGDSCYIYGTPTVALSQRTYTIVASNQYGDTLVDISIEVLPASTGGISGATGASAAQPPSANAGADQTVANAGGIVVIDASTSSAGDSEIAQYAWSQTSGTRVALYGTNTALASFNPADTGLNGDKLSFTVTITSSTGQAATDEVVVNVLPARPSLNSPTYTHIVSAGEPMAPIVLTNTGGGRLLAQAGCTANNLPKGLSISLSKDGHTCQIKGTPPTAQDNPISISIRATNATGTATSAAEVSLLVQ